MWSTDVPGKAILFFLFDFTVKGLHLKGSQKIVKMEIPEKDQQHMIITYVHKGSGPVVPNIVIGTAYH